MNTRSFVSLSSLRAALAVTALGWLAAACGGGAPVQENPVTSTPPPAGYSGPPPASQDVQSFKLNVWDNLQANNRCGSCHGEGGQAPDFVRRDDINMAYQAANGVVNLSDPRSSRMVTKVGGGHNCWLASDSACADQLTVWIRNWAGATLGGTREVVLQPPPLRDVGASKSFPAGSSGFGATVHPILVEHCSRCHVSSAQTAQSPFFAERDVDLAYGAARPRINLDAPELSRFVLRLREEFHNCWGDCAQNAATMEAAIRAFADGVPVTQVDPTLLASKALSLYEGTVASGGNRYDSSVIALFEFKTGTGTIAYDTSGVEPAANLNFSGDVEWVGGWGVNVRSGKLQSSTTGSRKLHDLIKATGEYSVEAWVAPANVVQEEAYIVSYSGGTTARNFTLGQTMYDYDFMNRSSTTGANGAPQLSTPSARQVLQATLQHVVATYDPVEGRRIYVNGELVTGPDPQGGGSLADWNDTFALVLGNEVSGDRQWQGVIRLAAVHNRALSQPQIAQNFEAGVGERFYMLFSIAHLVDIPDSYVLFEASQFDSYGYLFEKPSVVRLAAGAAPESLEGLRIAGMRLGINGAETRIGQAYLSVDATVNAAGYESPTGFPLASIGTVIGLDKGPALDQFFLTFERIGNRSRTYTEPALIAPPPSPDGPPQPLIGLRTFERIAASMSEVTGVPRTDPAVAETYERVKQQLPTADGIEGFLSSHQIGVAQMAIEFCNSLVDDGSRRAAFFAGFDFQVPAAQAFDTAQERELVIGPLVERAVGSGLASQPSADEVRTEITALMGRLTTCGAGCPAERTATVVKASCAAVLGSASTLLH